MSTYYHSNTFVYFIKPVGLPGPIKIGCSQKPKQRLETLASWSPYHLEILAVIDGDLSLEHNIHCCFADCHSHHEWFNPAPRLIEAIEKIAKGVPVAEAIDLSKRVGVIRLRGKRNYTDSERKYLSYGARLRNAYRKVHHYSNNHISSILGTWHSTKQVPCAEDLAILERAIKDPIKYGNRCYSLQEAA